MRVIPIIDLDWAKEFEETAQAVERGLDIAALEIREEFLSPTATWKDKPEFTIERGNFTRTIGTDSQKYAWVNYGTKAHTIRAKNKRSLRMSHGTPKTRHDSFASYDRTESYVFYAPEVRNPGIFPRNWEDNIVYYYGSGDEQYEGEGKAAEIIQAEIDKVP